MIKFTLRQLEYLIACVETGSLVSAAEKLNVSQPSISTAIAKLENQLGTQLLIRHHAQGVVPTASAKPLIQMARNLVSQAEDFQHAIEMSDWEIKGDFSFGSFFTLAPTFLPGLITALEQEYPGLKIKLREGTQDQLIAGLRAGEIEAALVYDHELPEDIEKTKLAELTPQVLLPSGHRLGEQAQVSLHELIDEPLILLDIQPSRQYFTGLLHSHGIEPNIRYRSSSIELVRGLVGRGLGYSLLVTRPPGDQTYDGQKLEIRPIHGDIEASSVVLCHLRSARKTRLMEALEQFVVSYFHKIVK